MSRPDQSITYLKHLGYCVVRLPRSDMAPLETLVRVAKKDLQRTGSLSAVMVEGANGLPPVSRDNVAPGSISGKETSSMKLEIGLNILGNIIRALGGSDLGLTAGYQRARTLVFQFDDVREDHADINLLDQFLTTASIRPDQKTITAALIDDKVYVVNSTLKTTRMTVHAKGENGARVGLDVPVIQQAVSGKLDVDVAKAVEGTVTYEGKTPVVFGFQAVRLIYDDATQSYTAVDPLDAGKMAARELGQIEPDYLELEEGVFFRVNDAGQAAGIG